MHADILISQIHSGILHIRLNRPTQLNALNHDLLLTLKDVLVNAKQNADIAGILISGEGKAFCAGADIKQLADLNGAKGLAFASFGQEIFSQLENLGKPSIAAIHGYAFGGGLELAMACTLRIAANNTQFSQPEIKLGVIPGFGGTQRLSRLIGKGRALDLCLTGRRIYTDEALAFGLINSLCEADELVLRATTWLKEIIQYSKIAITSTLTTIHQGYDLNLNDALQLEAAHFAICASTADKTEGVAAFLEKRTPLFKGE